MIKAITVTNDNGESLRLVLNNPIPSEIAVESVEGLEPEKANINSTENQVYDGSSYDSSNVPQKPITINLKFLPNDGNIERIRHKCYDFFPVTKNVKLEIETDERYLHIDGYVESNLPEIFSEMEGAAISVLCMDPYFKGHTDSKNMLKGVEDAFQFPFSNESLVEKLLIFGDIYDTNFRNIYYYGEKEAGVKIEITFKGDEDLLVIENVHQNIRQKILLNLATVKTQNQISEILEDDYMIIDTTSGNKNIDLYHYDSNDHRYIKKNALSGVDLSTLAWILLIKGYNKISFSSSNDDNIKEFIINNKVLYRGV